MKKILTSIYPFLVLNLVEEHTNQGMQYSRVEKKKSLSLRKCCGSIFSEFLSLVWNLFSFVFGMVMNLKQTGKYKLNQG